MPGLLPNLNIRQQRIGLLLTGWLVASASAAHAQEQTEFVTVSAVPAQLGAIQQIAATDEVPLRAWKSIVIHHSATAAGTVAGIDAEHRSRTDAEGRPWKGIGYHFVVGNGRGMEDGEVQATFRWRKQLAGAHAGDLQYNEQGIGICLIGNFEEQPPTAAQLQAARVLVRQLQHQFQMTDDQLLRHGDLKATACPGKLFTMDMIVATDAQPAKAGVATIPTGSKP